MASRNMAMLYGLGGKIRETRNRIGLSLTDLSVAVGSDKSALAKIERGERVPSLETVSKLADEMDVPMASWFQDEASHSASVMEQFIESRNNRLEKLSSEQLSSLQKMIDQALLMAGV